MRHGVAVSWVWLVLAGCPMETEPDPCAADTDGDGLSDCDELDLGTAIHLADTDGDGFSDRDEVIELGFRPENNNFRFNPLIADTPRLRVQIVSAPAITVDLRSKAGTVRTQGIERSAASTNAVTTANSSTNSRAIEQSVTASTSITTSASVGIFGPSGSVSATVSYEASTSTTQETSLSWSEEQRQENTEGIAQIEEDALKQSETLSGGAVSVALDVYNDGVLSYTLEQLSIAALMTNPGGEAILAPVGNLSFDTTQVSFPAFTSAPGERAGPFVFQKSDLDLATTLALVRDSTSLDIRVAAYEVSDEQGRSFTHDQTEIQAKTATVIIDYDGQEGRATERYQVATNVNQETGQISVGEVMQDILRVPYELDAGDRLAVARDVFVPADNTARVQWTVALKTTDGVQDALRFPQQTGIPFEDISLKAGDVLHLIYTVDQDLDRLGRRVERSLGSDDRNPDSDNDGRNDGDEVTEDGTSPVFNDRPFCLADTYDVDGNRANGCETTDDPVGNHTRKTAAFVDSLTSCDGSSDPEISGMLLSDLRDHDPKFEGFDPKTGSAPDWWWIDAVGDDLFDLCENEIDLMLTVTEADDPACYRMTVYTDFVPGGFTCATDETGTCLIEENFGEQYSDGSVIEILVERTCPPGVAVANYSVRGHL